MPGLLAAPGLHVLLAVTKAAPQGLRRRCPRRGRPVIAPDLDGFVLPGILRDLDRERMSLPRVPSGQAIKRADLAIARSTLGLCVTCGQGPAMENHLDCEVCREEGQRCDCDPTEEGR